MHVLCRSTHYYEADRNSRVLYLPVLVGPTDTERSGRVTHDHGSIQTPPHCGGGREEECGTPQDPCSEIIYLSNILWIGLGYHIGCNSTKLRFLFRIYYFHRRTYPANKRIIRRSPSSMSLQVFCFNAENTDSSCRALLSCTQH